MRALESNSGCINVDRGRDLDIPVFYHIESLIVADANESGIFGVLLDKVVLAIGADQDGLFEGISWGLVRDEGLDNNFLLGAYSIKVNDCIIVEECKGKVRLGRGCSRGERWTTKGLYSLYKNQQITCMS